MDLEILKIASNTDNNKIINDFTHKAKQKNSIGYCLRPKIQDLFFL